MAGYLNIQRNIRQNSYWGHDFKLSLYNHGFWLLVLVYLLFLWPDQIFVCGIWMGPLPQSKSLVQQRFFSPPQSLYSMPSSLWPSSSLPNPPPPILLYPNTGENFVWQIPNHIFIPWKQNKICQCIRKCQLTLREAIQPKHTSYLNMHSWVPVPWNGSGARKQKSG